MKISKKPIVFAAGGICLIIALFVLFGCVFAPCKVANAGLCNLLTPEIVAFYEEEIAKEAVLSNKSDDYVAAIATIYGMGLSKAKCAILLYDLANRTGGGTTFPEIARRSECTMLAFANKRKRDSNEERPN